ncbi:EAL domain-containing protein [Rhodoferax sp.]|uniref:EAL domain-containing protein n=3 Tax=Rhodoferax sp. TaxID=50421 RepID=UPI0027167F15|nr:EAL domain-containing protein [Rhodoferax sp.]MDO9143008.1 EAL domain-containing protein [Rhodoferax sp.]MDP1530192.1 EAL domain-containing protein [Rhodoferax sp.]MDP1945406.1 EAL domain-containing protein [Rhodoferax sp.]MDP2443174.1 EAL domain-containing protein [Rhodoferax sp.]MDP3191195.1 EAL domain-containing protein [Rhodoferax sp.]
MLSVALELTYNMAILVAMVLTSGLIRRSQESATRQAILQGLLFGTATVINMVAPMDLGSGLIFDPRTVTLSLCGLFFGPLAAGVAAALALAYRLPLGGAGVIMGVLVIVSAAVWGWYFYRRWSSAKQPIRLPQLLLLGLVVHLTELSLMATLPAPLGWRTLQSLGLPIMLAFPLLTLLLGKMLSSQDAVAQAVAALRKSEHQHRSILEAAMDGFWLTNLQGRLLEVNQAYARMSGYTVPELLGMHVSQFEAGESEALSLAHIQKVLAVGSDRFETRHLAKDGRVFDVEVSVQLHALEAGHVVAFLRDITERKRSEQALLDAKTLTEAIVENAPLMIFLKDARSLRFVLLNRAGENMLGFGRDDLIGKSDLDFFPSVQAEDFMRKDRTVLEGESGVQDTPIEAVQTAHQGVRFLHTRKVGIRGGDGQMKYLLGISEDVTEHKKAQERLLLTANVFTHAREGILITDAAGTIIDVNESFSRITGFSRAQALGKTPNILSSGHQTPDFYQAMWAALHRDGQWYGEIWNRRENGEVYAELLNISAVFDAQGQVQNYVALFSDITPIKEHEKELERIAHYDVLTGLPNRVLLADRLHQTMAQSIRRCQQLAVVYLDLDGFKNINDRHGHDLGDHLLRHVATRMKLALREGDTLARIGGDEFVAVLIDLDDSQAAVPLLDRLLSAAGEEVQLGDVSLQISASLGVTFYPQVEAVEADQLLRQADQAMYLAKLAGKNRFYFFDAENDRSTRGHFESLERIRNALAAQEFLLYYQPKVNMRTGAVIGVEALIRWQHPDRGLLAPALFLPVIEEHALAVVVGEWVMDTALSQMEHWQNDGLVLPESFNVSVNVGARQLQQGNFVAFLQTLLAAHPQIRPAQLEVEILETSALSDLAGLSRLIDDCHRLGVLFALDDFGTGYSSLSYLKHLRVSVLKMDQSFVRDMLDDPDDLAILRGVIGLADAFNRRVIAEGVETEAHGRRLLEMGCELGQGYAIARPLPAQAFPQWLQHWQQNPVWGVADVALAARSA